MPAATFCCLWCAGASPPKYQASPFGGVILTYFSAPGGPRLAFSLMLRLVLSTAATEEQDAAAPEGGAGEEEASSSDGGASGGSGSESIRELSATGGVSLLMLGAGALLLASGFVARRISGR